MFCSNKNRVIKSFVLRTGRITLGQKQALEMYWPKFGINLQKDKKLNFATIFGNPNPVTLEIGFGNGDSLVKMAINNPHRNFIGIEVYKSGVGKILQNIQNYSLQNLRVIQHDAVDVLISNVPNSSLDCVQIFFPDPWPKKRHHKRRIVNESFVILLSNKLKLGGILHLATDWEPYAQNMVRVIENSGSFKQLLSVNDKEYEDRLNIRPYTKFEARGKSFGYKITDIICKLIHS